VRENRVRISLAARAWVNLNGQSVRDKQEEKEGLMKTLCLAAVCLAVMGMAMSASPARAADQSINVTGK
jgi:hypothetical protein